MSKIKSLLKYDKDNIDKVYDEEQEETSQEEWLAGYRKWKEVK